MSAAGLSEDGKWRKRGFLVGVFAYAGLVYSLTSAVATQGWLIFTVLGALMCSIVPMGFIAKKYEFCTLRGAYNLRTGFWSFLIGDSIALPLALGACAVGWRSNISVPTWWHLGGFGIGCLAGWAFRKLDTRSYRMSGDEDLLDSPRKLYHDFGAYPSLFGLEVTLGGPLLWRAFVDGVAELQMPAVLFLTGGTMWVVMVGIDKLRDPFYSDSHVEYDWDANRPVYM